MTSLLAEVKDVLRPFAEFIRWSDAADGDEIINWHSNQGVGRRRITVGNLRAVKALLSRLEAQSGEEPAPRKAEDHEIVARWMVANGFATGHGDTLSDLLSELAWQITARGDDAFLSGRRSMQEEAAKVAEDTDYHGKVPVGWTLALDTAANRIRALNPETKP